MSDNLNKKAPQDPTKINVNQPWELNYWSKELGVTIKAIKDAVKAVGVMVRDVKEHLGK